VTGQRLLGAPQRKAACYAAATLSSVAAAAGFVMLCRPTKAHWYRGSGEVCDASEDDRNSAVVRTTCSDGTVPSQPRAVMRIWGSISAIWQAGAGAREGRFTGAYHGATCAA